MAIDTYALTSLATAKEYLRIATADTTNDDLITNSINRASAQVETICNRQFLTRSYAQWYDGNGERMIYLDHWPVTAVSRTSKGRLNALGVACNSTSMTWASARVTSTGLELVHVDSSGSTTTTLAFATYTTITDLATQIDATGSGWASQGLGYGDYLTADLAQTPALYCLNLYADLPQPYQALDNYLADEDTGRLFYGGGFARGTQNIYVEYTGGYSSIPYDVEQACLLLMASLYFSTSRDPGLQSEKLGDYAYAVKSGGSSGIMSEAAKMLEKYIRIPV